MTPSPQSQNPNPPLRAGRSVAGVVGRGTFGSIAVCRQGTEVALHIATPAGTFVFQGREKDFVRGCRGAADHNGNRFRTIEEIERTCVEPPSPVVEAAAPAPAVALLPVPRRPLTPYEQGWEYLTTHLHLPVAVVAQHLGLHEQAFAQWVCYHHPRELGELRRAAGLGVSPRRGGSAPVNLSTAAAAGRPLLKPGGKL